MLIKDWMSKTLASVKTTTSIMKAAKLMKENGYGRLPVVDDDGRLLGIITDRDVKEASPSKATTLDMHELYYLLSEIKVGDIMTKTVISVSPDDTVEKAAVLMLRHNVGGMPVVDAQGLVDAHTGLFTIAGFLRDLARAVEDAQARGLALSLARFSFPSGLDQRASLDAARLAGRDNASHG